ncbi:MAG: AIR synthase related protein, partial [Pseudomonadota bacterium]
MQLKEVGEFKLIDVIAKLTAASNPKVIKGIGDDAAVVRLTAKTRLLVTTDILTEGIHFQKRSTSPYLLGKKCISVNLSDIAAMGGVPLY